MKKKLHRQLAEKSSYVSLILALALFAMNIFIGVELKLVKAEGNELSNGVVLEQKAVLTILLRNSHGKPLGGAICEILSYDWGLQKGQPFSVIARGETDANGGVAFDVADWPRSGYRFRFSPTPRLYPPQTYIVPESENQYRGYPAAVIGGGTSETQRFFIASDGLAYNDQSLSTSDLPTSKRDPVGGLEQSRVTVMASADFLATVKAGTATAIAKGVPTPTFPPPPPSRVPGYIQPALTVTPSAATDPLTTTVTMPTATVGMVTTTATASSSTVAAAISTPVPGAPAQSGSESRSKSATGRPDLLGSLLLATCGIFCLVFFWLFRYQVYRLLGIEVSKPTRPQARKVLKTTDREKPEPAKQRSSKVDKEDDITSR